MVIKKALGVLSMPDVNPGKPEKGPQSFNSPRAPCQVRKAAGDTAITPE